MRCVDLFAGAGGASLGLSRAGWTVHAVEKDPHACATLRAAGHARVYETTIEESTPWLGPRPELVWASPPCQPGSVAGERKGEADARDGYPALFAALEALGWPPLLSEQVPGFQAHRGAGCDATCCGCYWERILARLRERYAHVEVRQLLAADYGTPQARKRLITWAGSAPFRWPQPSHRDPRTPHLWLRPWMSSGEALGLLASERLIGGGGNPHGPGRPHERTFRDLTDEPALTVAAVVVGNRGPWLVGAGGPDRPAPTVRACKGVAHAIVGPGYRRRLSPSECGILQGFPPDYPWTGTLTAQHRQVGNAVPPPLAEALGRSALACLR